MNEKMILYFILKLINQWFIEYFSFIHRKNSVEERNLRDLLVKLT